MTNRRSAKVAQPDVFLTPGPMHVEPQILWPDQRHGPWRLTPHWARVKGRAIMVGLDIRSFYELPEPDGRFPGLGQQRHRNAVGREGLVEVTQRVLRGIPISEVRDASGDFLAQNAAALRDMLTDEYEVLRQRWAEQADAFTTRGTPRKRTPNVTDDTLRRVADIYTAAVTDLSSKTPAKAVEEQLRAEGHPLLMPGKSGRDQVRKWIQRARDRDDPNTGEKFLPPPGLVTSPPTTRKGNHQ